MKDRPIKHTYVLSETLCDFRSLCAFRIHVVSDFWVCTFRFLIICFPIFGYVIKILQKITK